MNNNTQPLRFGADNLTPAKRSTPLRLSVKQTQK